MSCEAERKFSKLQVIFSFPSIMLKERLKSCGALWKAEPGDVLRKSRVDPYYGVWKDPKICTSLAMESHLGLVKATLSGFSVLGAAQPEHRGIRLKTCY